MLCLEKTKNNKQNKKTNGIYNEDRGLGAELSNLRKSTAEIKKG